MSSPRNNTTVDNRQSHCKGRFVRTDLKAFLDGELPRLRHWMVSFHLSRCANCREEITWLQRLGKNMRTLDEVHPRPELRARILATLPPMDSVPRRPANTATPVKAYRRPALQFGLAGAFALLLAIGGIEALQRGQSQAGLVAGTDGSNTPAGIVVKVAPTRTKPVEQKAIATNDSHSDAPPADLTAEDPTSREANRLAALQREQQRQSDDRNLPGLWQKAIAAAQIGNSGATAKQPKQQCVQVAVEVSSTETAQTRLAAWAKQAQAEMVVVPNQHASNWHGTPPVQIILRISPTAGNSLLASLRASGKVSDVSSSDPATTVVGGASGMQLNPSVPTYEAGGASHKPAVTKLGQPDARPVIPDKTGVSKPRSAELVVIVVNLLPAA